jgi:putative transposase
LITYIHQNPQIHGFADDYRDWPYSSYQTFLSQKTTQLNRIEALAWFENLDGFVRFHENMSDFRQISPLVDDGFT